MAEDQAQLFVSSFQRQWDRLPADMSSAPLEAAIEDSGLQTCYTCGGYGVITAVEFDVPAVLIHHYANTRECRTAPVCRMCLEQGAAADYLGEDCPLCSDSVDEDNVICDDVC